MLEGIKAEASYRVTMGDHSVLKIARPEFSDTATSASVSANPTWPRSHESASRLEDRMRERQRLTDVTALRALIAAQLLGEHDLGLSGGDLDRCRPRGRPLTGSLIPGHLLTRDSESFGPIS